MPNAVIFDLDDTLYDTTLQVNHARENAIKAMVATGLHTTEEKAKEALIKVVAEKGPNYQHHYDEMLKTLGMEPHPKIIAAGIVAYHETKRTYLTPYSDTIPTILALRGKGHQMAVVTDGIPVKQWEKLIRLGLADFFQTVIITENPDEQKPSPKPFMKAAEALGVRPDVCFFVGDRLDRDIKGANAAGMVTIQIVSGRYPRNMHLCEDIEPDYIVTKLGDIIRIVSTFGNPILGKPWSQ